MQLTKDVQFPDWQEEKRYPQIFHLGQSIWDQYHQHGYEQLLCMQISKAQKDSQVISVFFPFCDLYKKSCW